MCRPGRQSSWGRWVWPYLTLYLLACDATQDSGKPSAERAARSARAGVVSLAPVASRFVRALGAEAQLVGLDAGSAKALALGHLPQVDLAGASALEPRLVLVSALPAPEDPALGVLIAMGAQVVEFEPHDLEDVLELVRNVGAELVGSERATRFQVALSRPLARIGGSSGGQPRPRVVALRSFDPLVIAGGHSFETDLIEIAGGHSVTHPGEEEALRIDADRWESLAPDLILVVGAHPEPAEARRAIVNALPASAKVEFFRFDPEFWLKEPTLPAQRLRAVIEPLSRGMAQKP